METKPVYKVRRIAKGESIIHVPSRITGYFELDVKANGDMYFRKVSS